MSSGRNRSMTSAVMTLLDYAYEGPTNPLVHTVGHDPEPLHLAARERIGQQEASALANHLPIDHDIASLTAASLRCLSYKWLYTSSVIRGFACPSSFESVTT